MTSFLTIGGIWLVHHGIVRRLQYANRQLMVVNLLLLMLVSFLPFPTKLMAEAIHKSTRRAPQSSSTARPVRHLTRPLASGQPSHATAAC